MKIISSQSQIYTWFSVYPTFFTGVIPCSAGTIKTEPVRITEERLYMLHALPVTNQRHHGNASSHGISPYGLSRSTTITHLSASFLRTTSANRYQQVPACHKCQTILSLMKQEILKRLRGGSCITQTIWISSAPRSKRTTIQKKGITCRTSFTPTLLCQYSHVSIVLQFKEKLYICSLELDYISKTHSKNCCRYDKHT